ncbi:hypothetical protein HPB50_011908 [Hyalomma asiaticum]|uniref:Uncharacterized protein n=1 Tax=Hyalomma asiaticum TaxID=266040 RepID=A0ACB7TH70_HYAAI|nr:hypothetical protein HPB50_011908 [Hyalomma asiaticum]
MMKSPGKGGVPPSSPTDAVAIECLVTWNDRKKVISVSGKEKYHVIGALSNTDIRSALEGGHMEDSWKVLFRYKLGNIRKSLDPTPVIKMAREKFGKKAATTKHYDGQARRTCHVLHQEFLDITGIHLEKKLLSFINTYGERCFHLAKSRRLVSQYASRIEEELLTMAGDAKKSMCL